MCTQCAAVVYGLYRRLLGRDLEMFGGFHDTGRGVKRFATCNVQLLCTVLNLQGTVSSGIWGLLRHGL